MVKVVPPAYNAKLPLTKPVEGVSGKTGLWRTMYKPVVDNSKCTRCFLCEIYCPGVCITVDPVKGTIINYDYCKGCGLCTDVCPVKAISMVPEE
ncbi:MAG: 4Fe-4S binding protein [Ignisphaera sp.]|nr:4Fe-4S binding protein [Ignisphaera sp.]